MHIVKDPIFDRYFEFNFFQIEILNRLDGTRSIAEVARDLSESFEVEVDVTDVAEFVDVLRRNQLMVVTAINYRSPEIQARIAAIARKDLVKEGFSIGTTERRRASREASDRRTNRSEERSLFAEGLEALHSNDPQRALGCFDRVLERFPKNARAQRFRDAIQRACLTIRASSAGKSEFAGATRRALFNPDRFLTRLDGLIGGFVFSPAFLLVWASTVVTGVAILLANTEEIKQSVSALGVSTVGVTTVIYLTVAVFLHEMSHGLACKHFGGTVKSIGMAFVYMVPVAYCDVSDAYFFSRRNRVFVSLAGIISDCFMTSLWTILWRVSAPGTFTGTIGAVVAAVAALQTLLNLVPFIKLDGYYILMDLLRRPNLYQEAAGYAQAALISLLTGTNILPPVSGAIRALYVAYQIPATLWRLYILISFVLGVICVYLVANLGGWGVAISAGIIVGSVGGIILPLARMFWSTLRSNLGAFFRPAHLVQLVLILGAPVAIMGLVRWSVKVKAPVTLEPGAHAMARASEPGRVAQVYVAEGQAVARQQPLLRLDTSQLEAQLAAVRAARQIVRFELEEAKRGAVRPRLEVARARVALEETRARYAAAEWERARRLASAGGATQEAEMVARRQLASSENLIGEAVARLRTVAAKAPREQIFGLRAELARADVEEAVLLRRIQLSVVRAPIGGRVLTVRPAEFVGRWVGSGEGLFEIADARRMKAILRAPADDVADVHVGAPVRFKLWALPSDQTVECAVNEVGQKATATRGYGRVFETRCPVNNPESLALVGGMTGRAEIVLEPVPLAKVLFRPAWRLLKVDLWGLL
ncbi:MAG: HlyD family efflux transporter periplasmic adaptor subunit [Deltaproteobacteria bacterium]|nr:HlyD family efflux transporter periplasmic adaptor subunit [Deltaproteobacteria bacterium]